MTEAELTSVDAESQSTARHSSPFSWIRTREFEGTLDRGPSFGVWGINYHRVNKYFGFMDVEFAHDTWPPAILPSSLDNSKELAEIPYYQRLYSFDDCVTGFGDGLHVKAAFYVSEKWRDLVEGRLDFDQTRDEIIGGHAMDLVPAIAPLPYPLDWPKRDFLISQNTWGQAWGNYGFAAIKRSFFENNMYEAWGIPFRIQLPRLVGRGLIRMEYILDASDVHRRYLLEYRDLDTGKPIAWAFFLLSNMQMYVDELFVVPGFRNKGFGTELISRMRELAGSAKPNFWIPFADIETQHALESLKTFFEKRGLFFHNTRYKFAGYVANSVRNTKGLEEIYVPPKPAFVFAGPKPLAVDHRLEANSMVLQEKHNVTDEFRRVAVSVLSRHHTLLERLAK